MRFGKANAMRPALRAEAVNAARRACGEPSARRRAPALECIDAFASMRMQD
jgi:hypothetical protein